MKWPDGKLRKTPPNKTDLREPRMSEMTRGQTGRVASNLRGTDHFFINVAENRGINTHQLPIQDPSRAADLAGVRAQTATLAQPAAPGILTS